MNNLRISLLATTFFFGASLLAMDPTSPRLQEQSPAQQTEAPTISLLDVFASAKSYRTQSSLDHTQFLEHVHSLDLTTELKNLTTATAPKELKMATDDITTFLDITDISLSKEKREMWAYRTGMATAACCMLSCLKPYAQGLFDAVPTEYATIILSSVWATQVRERRAQRAAIANDQTLLAVLDTKATDIVKKTIQAIQKRQHGHLLEKEQQQATDQQEASSQDNESKKDK